ncbi:MAG: PHB depolymerase family esterase [Woeseiaceae bacterium]|nr:PHB depolymerase family esterase [Woeseiaceae bacterium]
MRSPLIPILLGLTIIAACGKAPEPERPAQMERHTLQHDGLTREYFVFLPSTYGGDTAPPVALFLHGYGGTATGTEAQVAQGLNRYAEEYGYAMVYPQGTWFMSSAGDGKPRAVTSWNHISDGFDTGPAGPICTPDRYKVPCPPECGNCGRCGWTSCNDDVGFLKSLVDEVIERWSVDNKRVYVAGFSNGAMMANRMACEASELFAAAALVGGRLEPGFECTPTRQMPLLQINGGADETVPHDGRVSSGGWFFASTTAVSREWNDEEACGVDLENWTSPLLENENVQCTIACGDTTHPSIDCLWPDGDHRWPGTPGSRGSGGHCVTGLQSLSMPDQTICIEPEENTDAWGSRLLFGFFDTHQGQR